MAFSTPMVDVLVDEGYEWVIVASHHVSRTCPTYIQAEGDPEGTDHLICTPKPESSMSREVERLESVRGASVIAEIQHDRHLAISRSCAAAHGASSP